MTKCPGACKWLSDKKNDLAYVTGKKTFVIFVAILSLLRMVRFIILRGKYSSVGIFGGNGGPEVGICIEGKWSF